MNQEKFTVKALEALENAQNLAIFNSNNFIDAWHLIHSIIEQSE
jgi:ATP-dependent Clp protease ATP-binding subunit ClpA